MFLLVAPSFSFSLSFSFLFNNYCACVVWCWCCCCCRSVLEDQINTLKKASEAKLESLKKDVVELEAEEM